MNSRPANCDSLMDLGQSSTSGNILSVSRGRLTNVGILVTLKYLGVIHVVLSRHKLSCEQFSSPFSLTTFTTHSSSVDWCIMMAWTFVCQNQFLRCGQVNSVLCLLLRSSKKFDDSLSWITSASLALLSRQIVPLPMVEDKLYAPMEKDMFVFLLYECVHLPYSFQSSFCNRVMISCSIHGVDELYSCKEFCVIHHSWWNNPLMVFGLHEYRPFTDLKLLR